MTITKTLQQIAYLIRLDKPVGTLLLLFPTLWGLWLASERTPDANLLFIFVVGVFLMRSAGCIMNDIADRHIDRHVKRTNMRPLAANTLSIKIAIIVLICLLSLAFLLIQSLNRYTIQLAWLGLLLAAIYPLLKRVTHLPQVGLGFAFAFGIPMSFAAIHNSIPANAWLLYAAAVIWSVIYDTQYAMVDRDDDKKIGVKSTAILFEQYDLLIMSILMGTFLLLLLASGIAFHLHTPFYLSLLWVALCFCYQLLLLKTRTRKGYFAAFKNNQWVGLIILLGCII